MEHASTFTIELNATTVALFLGTLVLGLLTWFIKRLIDSYDKKLEKLEAVSTGGIGKAEFTLFREVTGQQLTTISGDLKTNQQLILSLLKRDLKE